jgi:hypothetical protein
MLSEIEGENATHVDVGMRDRRDLLKDLKQRTRSVTVSRASGSRRGGFPNLLEL